MGRVSEGERNILGLTTNRTDHYPRRRAVKDLLVARSNGISFFGTAVPMTIFVWTQSQDSPLIDQFINPSVAGLLVGTGVSMLVTWVTSPNRRQFGNFQEEEKRRDAIARRAWNTIRKKKR